jgi:uncharacterized protein DUF3108
MPMRRAAETFSRYRLVAVALALSAAAHAAIFAAMPRRLAGIEQKAAAIYSATLDPAATNAVLARPTPRLVAAAALKLRPAVRRAASRLAESPVIVAQGPVSSDAATSAAATASDAASALAAAEVPRELLPLDEAPEVIAMAETAVPLEGAEPDKFPVGALPASISISYRITSAFADGRAVYSWEREGDNYRITGEAEAEGFFTLFLEGQIRQESRGTVTEAGLRPDSFEEVRPNSAREGLEFDWPTRQVTFSRDGKSNTSPLADNTVDWLSMIFQMAHVPPQGESMRMQVFTQRKMYRFRLQVLGVEEIDIPIGKVRALHLRHFDPADDREAVDVWLGVEQHNLPVKLRFPVARNRLMVEQVATRVSVK